MKKRRIPPVCSTIQFFLSAVCRGPYRQAMIGLWQMKRKYAYQYLHWEHGRIYSTLSAALMMTYTQAKVTEGAFQAEPLLANQNGLVSYRNTKCTNKGIGRMHVWKRWNNSNIAMNVNKVPFRTTTVRSIRYRIPSLVLKINTQKTYRSPFQYWRKAHRHLCCWSIYKFARFFITFHT